MEQQQPHLLATNIATAAKDARASKAAAVAPAKGANFNTAVGWVCKILIKRAIDKSFRITSYYMTSLKP